MSETIERVAKAISDAIDPTSGDPIGVTFHHSEFVEGETMQEQLEQVKSICLAAARAAIESCGDAFAGYLEQLVEERRAARPTLRVANDYILICAGIIRRHALTSLSQSPSSLPTPAATPTDSANPPPVESVGPNSEAQS